MGLGTNEVVKLAFSEKELSYLADTDFLLTKQKINQQIVQTLSLTEKLLKSDCRSLNDVIPQEVLSKAGKISRGENYLGLPYWVLDMPRFFHSKDVFAFRTMIWWGHEISATLHLAGRFLTHHENNFERMLAQDIPGLFVSINSSPWVYEFSEENYQPLSQINTSMIKSHMDNYQFLKLSFKLPISEMLSLPEFASNSFKRLIKLIN